MYRIHSDTNSISSPARFVNEFLPFASKFYFVTKTKNATTAAFV